MKAKTNLLKGIAAFSLSLVFGVTALFAEGETSDMYLSGSSNSAAGNYVVTASDDVYHFQGHEYKVYNVYYDNPEHNMKIAVLEEGNCKSYIAYTDQYWFMYNCTKKGFGVRKAMFSSPAVSDNFNAENYQDQTVLLKTRKIDRDMAIGLIASYLPRLQG